MNIHSHRGQGGWGVTLGDAVGRRLLILRLWRALSLRSRPVVRLRALTRALLRVRLVPRSLPFSGPFVLLAAGKRLVRY